MNGLGQPLDVVRRMNFPEVARLYAYWEEAPPVAELLAMLAGAFTTWKPKAKNLTPNDPAFQAEHRKSLEKRWARGAVNPAQLFALQRQ